MSTFDGYFREFDGLVRADNFQDSSKRPAGLRPSLLFLLSHAHVDHMVDLQTFSGSTIYCSDVTKDIVLKHRPVNDRVAQAAGLPSSKAYTYRNLASLRAVGPNPNTLLSRDLLQPIPLLTPTRITLPNPQADECSITLFSANHCPGSVMFLIQMWAINVLYTGDVRAEPWWVESLTKEPLLAPHVAFPNGQLLPSSSSGSTTRVAAVRAAAVPLDNIYLDTSAIFTKREVLTKDEAICLTIDMISAYPDDTIFFINAWTWGYEELLQRLAHHFSAKIHVDEFKHEVYSQPSFRRHYPFLHQCATLDASQTRFHACERRWRCDCTWASGLGCAEFEDINLQRARERKREACEGRRIVFVNPWEITTSRWNLYYHDLSGSLRKAASSSGTMQDHTGDCPWPSSLISPFARHSSTTEIQRFVSIFRPKSLFPNTTQLKHGFLEYHAMPFLFQDQLHQGCHRELSQRAIEFTKFHEHRLGCQLPNWRLIYQEPSCLTETIRTQLLSTFSETDQSAWTEMFQAPTESTKRAVAKYLEPREVASTRALSDGETPPARRITPGLLHNSAHPPHSASKPPTGPRSPAKVDFEVGQVACGSREAPIQLSSDEESLAPPAATMVTTVLAPWHGKMSPQKRPGDPQKSSPTTRHAVSSSPQNSPVPSELASPGGRSGREGMGRLRPCLSPRTPGLSSEGSCVSCLAPTSPSRKALGKLSKGGNDDGTVLDELPAQVCAAPGALRLLCAEEPCGGAQSPCPPMETGTAPTGPQNSGKGPEHPPPSMAMIGACRGGDERLLSDLKSPLPPKVPLGNELAPAASFNIPCSHPTSRPSSLSAQANIIQKLEYHFYSQIYQLSKHLTRGRSEQRRSRSALGVGNNSTQSRKMVLPEEEGIRKVLELLKVRQKIIEARRVAVGLL